MGKYVLVEAKNRLDYIISYIMFAESFVWATRILLLSILKYMLDELIYCK